MQLNDKVFADGFLDAAVDGGPLAHVTGLLEKADAKVGMLVLSLIHI